MNTTHRFKWTPGKAEGFYMGKFYGWTSSDTPAVWEDGKGWKPLIWKSFHNIKSISGQRKIIREMIASENI